MEQEPQTGRPASESSTSAEMHSLSPMLSDPTTAVNPTPPSLLGSSVPEHMSGAPGDWSGFPFATFLSYQGVGESPEGWGQTLPPEYADIDIDQLLKGVGEAQPAVAADMVQQEEEPTEAELEHL